MMDPWWCRPQPIMFRWKMPRMPFRYSPAYCCKVRVSGRKPAENGFASRSAARFDSHFIDSRYQMCCKPAPTARSPVTLTTKSNQALSFTCLTMTPRYTLQVTAKPLAVDHRHYNNLNPDDDGWPSSVQLWNSTRLKQMMMTDRSRLEG